MDQKLLLEIDQKKVFHIKRSEIFCEPRTRKRTKSKAGRESRNGIILNPGLGQTQTISGQTCPLNSAVKPVLYIYTFQTEND